MPLVLHPEQDPTPSVAGVEDELSRVSGWLLPGRLLLSALIMYQAVSAAVMNASHSKLQPAAPITRRVACGLHV